MRERKRLEFGCLNFISAGMRVDDKLLFKPVWRSRTSYGRMPGPLVPAVVASLKLIPPSVGPQLHLHKKQQCNCHNTRPWAPDSPRPTSSLLLSRLPYPSRTSCTYGSLVLQWEWWDSSTPHSIDRTWHRPSPRPMLWQCPARRKIQQHLLIMSEYH